MNRPRLAILIPTLPTRGQLLARLMAQLAPQLTPAVQVLINQDSGAKTTGAKRNELLGMAVRAGADLVSFFDDDDEASTEYVSSILAALDKTPYADVVSIRGTFTFDNSPLVRQWEHSLKHKAWIAEPVDGWYLRPPNHLNPIRLPIAWAIGYPNKTLGEDRDYAERLLDSGLLEVEADNPATIYHYRYATKKPVETEIAKAMFQLGGQ